MPNPHAKTLGEFLRRARLDVPLTLRALATKLGVTASYLSDIENNRRVPSEALIGRLAKNYRIGRSALMALAGRLDETVATYVAKEPLAGRLVRFITRKRFTQRQLRLLLQYAAKLERLRAIAGRAS